MTPFELFNQSREIQSYLDSINKDYEYYMISGFGIGNSIIDSEIVDTKSSIFEFNDSFFEAIPVYVAVFEELSFFFYSRFKYYNNIFKS
jgi:hypothetical protein